MAHHPDSTSTDTTFVSQDQFVTSGGRDHHGSDDADLLPRRGRGHDDSGYEMPSDGEAAAREKFGGLNWGASFFGWLVAVAFVALLAGVAGAIATALGTTAQIRSDAQGGASLIAAGVFLVLVLLGYYTGGYVAGRMSRFDGGRQGFGVWLVSLVVAAAVVGLGVFLGGQYDLRGLMDLPGLPFSAGQVGWQILVGAGLLVLAGTMLAAVLGGSVGRRYHRRVDRAVLG